MARKMKTVKKMNKSKRNRYQGKNKRLTKRNRKTLSKKQRKQRKQRQQKKQRQQRQQVQQKGGFVKPFIPEFKNLVRFGPYKASENYHTINPEPYPAPGNPSKVDINPHPGYDQYLRGNNRMLNPDEILGPNLKQEFDDSIKSNPNM